MASLRKLADIPAAQQRTTKVDASTRIWTHQDGDDLGEWMYPVDGSGNSLLLPDGSVTSSTMDSKSIDRKVLSAGQSGDQQVYNDVDINRTSYSSTPDYYINCGIISATGKRLLWGFAVSGYTDSEFVGGKVMYAKAELRVGGTLVDTLLQALVAGCYCHQLGVAVLGAGTGQMQRAITCNYSGSVQVRVFTTVQLLTGSPTSHGVLLEARGWWTEI